MEVAAEAMVSPPEMTMIILAQLLPLIVILIICLIGGIINGIFCKKLAARKGYKGYFWTGFFFGWLGFFYVHGLPDLNIRKDMRAVMKRLVAVSDHVTKMESDQYKDQ